MKTYTEEEADEIVNKALQSLPHGAVDDDDGAGQIIIYTGIFKLPDGTYSDTPKR